MKQLIIATIAIGLFVFSSIAVANYGRSYSECAAQTTCNVYCHGPYGPYVCGAYPIYCKTWADGSAAACTWEWFFDSHVRCTGLTAEGFWDVVIVSCR